MSAPAHILVLCSYNRARSVLAEHLLHRALTEAGVAATVAGAGFRSHGEPPVYGVAEALATMGIDAADHRSTRFQPAMAAAADLVLAAERVHVIRAVEDDPEGFTRSFTLPEFAVRAAADPRRGRSMAEWCAALNHGRSRSGFLHGDAAELPDPTGGSTAAVLAAARQIDALCRAIAGAW